MKKSIISVLSAAAGVAVGVGAGKYVESIKTRKQGELASKHMDLYMLMNQWVRIKQEGKSIAGYFEKNGFNEIAIYGMHFVGETLLNEISGTSVKVKYGIDKNADAIYTDIDVVSPDDELEPVDAVVVTAITFYEEIADRLSQKVNCPILSIEDILFEV